MQISIELTAIITMAVISIFWFAGLSFSTRQNSKDIEKLQTNHDDLGNKIETILSTLSRIEGTLQATRDIREK